MTDVLLSERAQDRLAAFESDTRERIKTALREIDPERDLSRLSGEDTYRLRVGDYRVIVDWDQANENVYVLTLGHRRNIYDRGW